MESLMLYVVVAAALGLMLAGAYGAAPMLPFTRHPHAHPGGIPAIGGAFALGAAFPLLEQDLSQSMARNISSALSSPRVAAAAEAMADRDVEASPLAEPPSDSPAFVEGPDAAPPHFDDDLLGDLFSELEMLRCQIEGLRAELGLFSAQAGVAVSNAEASSEPRRKSRAQPRLDMPPALRRRLTDLRSRRGGIRV